MTRQLYTNSDNGKCNKQNVGETLKSHDDVLKYQLYMVYLV